MGFVADIWAADRQASAARDASRDSNRTQLEIFNQIRDDNAPFREGGYGAYGALQGLLGLGDPAQGQQAFQQYQDSTGYQFRLGQGIQAIDRGAAARGGLNSGATMKALAQYGQNIGSQEFGNYLNQLQGVIAPGQQALNQNAQAGQNYANANSNNNWNAANARGSAYGQMGRAAGGAIDRAIGYFG